MFDIATTSAT